MELTKETMDNILYTKYYLYTEFKKEYVRIYGNDAGIEQQHFKLLEEIEQKLVDGVDWEIIEKIENSYLRLIKAFMHLSE